MSDSAGQPWAGRGLPDSGFAGDLGAADPALARQLAGEDDRALMRALADARVLVPVVAEPAEVDDGGGLAVEKSTEMAVITLTAPDGRRGMPVFSSLSALASWNADARPVPVTSAHAAQAVIAEGCDVLLLDLGSPHAHVLRTSMVWALAQRREWLPAHEDPFVAEAVGRAAAAEPEVVSAACGPGPLDAPATLTVTLRVVPGLHGEAVRELATRVAERLATDGETRARVDGLSFRLERA
ncbi:MAG TPA: SseB family protein [Dermatophilaceae bacterium]|nr:SseB family protein [Dermatophilaceae bacterium]